MSTSTIERVETAHLVCERIRPEHFALPEAERAAVSRHRDLLREHKKIMAEVSAALRSNQQEVRRLRQTRPGSP